MVHMQAAIVLARSYSKARKKYEQSKNTSKSETPFFVYLFEMW